jgi:hypothetical protein
MWQLTKEEGKRRIYFNSATGSQCATSNVYKDKEGNDWWSFEDLTAMPYTRTFAATKISSLYALGLSKDDLSKHISGLKTILKSNDPEKYEKAYSAVLSFESLAGNATDAIKQMSSLVCVYFLLNDEIIDSFDGNLQSKKMAILEADHHAHSFFLTSLIDLTEHYTTSLNLLSTIVSQKPNGNAVRSV